MLDELGARDHLVLVMHQVGEYPVFVRGQPDLCAVEGDPVGAGIEADLAADQLGGGVSRRAPDQGAQPRQHLLDAERLGHVVVGAGIEARDLLRPGIARGQDQHRHIAAPGAPSGEHGHAVDFRQPQIQHHRIVGLGVAEEMALLAVEGGVDGVVGLAQRGDELAVQVFIVLDYEYAHGPAETASYNGRERRLPTRHRPAG